MQHTLAIAVCSIVLVACANQLPTEEVQNAPSALGAAGSHKPKLLIRECRNLPEYPSASRQRGETGTVRLAFLVDATGKVTQSEVRQSSGHALLDQAALNTLARCPFQPAYLDGKPVPAEAIITYAWKIQ